MDDIPETFGKYFNILYEKGTYLDKFGGSVVVTGITLLIFFVIFSYYYIENKIEPIRRNWVNERCKPEIMPWAGFINAKDAANKGQTQAEYTGENFYQCTTLVLKKVLSHFTSPVYYLTKLLQHIMNLILNAVNAIRMFIDLTRIKLTQIGEYLVARIVNVTIPLQISLIKMKDMLGKVSGSLVSALYTIFGSYLAMKAMLGAFLQILIIWLIMLAAFIVIMWIMPWTWGYAIAATIFFLLIAIPIAIIAVWMNYILKISSRSVPKANCFDKNTIIKTKKGDVPIKNLKSGTILENGDKVTAIFKLALNNADVYNLNGITVTGTHKVLHDNMGWIFVKDHPHSKKLEDYREPAVYCFSTQSKRIHIKDYKFLDWDDLEPIDIMKLKNLKYLKQNCSLGDVHKYLESGIYGETMIELESGHSVKIKNIKINDQLKFGERVLGIVEIDTEDIQTVKKYKFQNFNIIGGPNIHFNDADLGNFNTLNISGEKVQKPNKLYHLLTDTQHFSINGYKIRDYNSAIENILDIRDKFYALF